MGLGGLRRLRSGVGRGWRRLRRLAVRLRSWRLGSRGVADESTQWGHSSSEPSEPSRRSEGDETGSERAQADLPAHLAFDRPPAFVFVWPWHGKDLQQTLSFRNACEEPLSLHTQWAALDPDEREGPCKRERREKLRLFHAALGTADLGPGQTTTLTLSADPLPPPSHPCWQGAECHDHQPIVLELYSAAAGQAQITEVEVLFVLDQKLCLGVATFAMPYSPRPFNETCLYRDSAQVRRSYRPYWLRLREASMDALFRPLARHRHFLLRGEQEALAGFRFRLQRPPKQEELKEWPGDETRSFMEGEVADYVRADEADAAAVAEARPRDAQQALVERLAEAAFARPPLPELPVNSLKYIAEELGQLALRLWPPHLLRLPPYPAQASLRLSNITNWPLVWSLALPPGCPLAAEETEGLLEGLLDLELGLSRPLGEGEAAGPLLLTFRFGFAPAEEDEEPLPQCLSDFLDAEEREPGRLAYLSLPLALPQPLDQPTLTLSDPTTHRSLSDLTRPPHTASDPTTLHSHTHNTPSTQLSS